MKLSSPILAVTGAALLAGCSTALELGDIPALGRTEADACALADASDGPLGEATGEANTLASPVDALGAEAPNCSLVLDGGRQAVNEDRPDDSSAAPEDQDTARDAPTEDNRHDGQADSEAAPDDGTVSDAALDATIVPLTDALQETSERPDGSPADADSSAESSQDADTLTALPSVFWRAITNWEKLSPTSPADWSVGNWKGACQPGQPAIGLSQVIMTAQTHAVLCSLVSTQSDYPQTTACHPVDFNGFNNSTVWSYDTGDGDWDPGYWKGGCQANEFVAGIAESMSGSLTSLLCCPGNNIAHRSCAAYTVYQKDTNVSGPDWDVWSFKSQCPAGQYLAGVSAIIDDGKPGVLGAAHDIFCCSP